jgi:predicted Zn-dependent peptidase
MKMSIKCIAASGLLLLLFLSGIRVSEAQNLEAFEERVTEFTLENGLHFIIIERDIAPVASFVTFVDVGSVNEPVNNTGIAHIFEHMVFKGSKDIGTTNWEEESKHIEAMDHAYRAWVREKYRPVPDEEKMAQYWEEFEKHKEAAAEYVVTNEFDEIVSREGAAGLNAFTSADATGYFYSLPQNKAELWFSLESDRFKNPVFREFFEEKEVIMEERRMRTDSNPVGRLVEEFISVAFSAHPYRNPVIGWPSDITTTTIEDTRRFYETYYSPSSFTIAIAGDVDPVQMREFAEIYFSDIPAGDPAPEVRTVEPEQRGERRFVIEDDSQPFFIAGYHTVHQMHEDWPALQLLGSIISEGRTSRLYRRMVQDEQLALNVQAFNGFPGTKYPSMFVTFAVPNQGIDLDIIESTIDEEIQKTKEGDITQEELDRAVTNARADLVRGLNNNMGLALQLAETHGQQGDWRRVFTYLDELQSVTLDDLQRVASQYLVQKNRTVGKIVNREAEEIASSSDNE